MKIERWKPTKGEMYFYISNVLMVADDVVDGYSHLDEERIAAGNCFATYNEAQAAAEKVKALLLSIQDKSLPKLTAEVFDRPDCPEWAKWAAVDRNGIGYFFPSKPSLHPALWVNHSTDKCAVPISGKFDASDYQNSLIERPAKLPNWCKVGEYVYDPLYGYGEIVSASENHFYAEFDGHAAEYSLENVPELKQARLRQYTAAELRKLVGAIIEETACGCGESSLLVTAYNSGRDVAAEPAVMLLDEWIGVNELCAGDYSVDGHSCGVFEHLEDGEWVE